MADGKKPTAPLQVIPGEQDPNPQGEDHFEFDMDNLSEFARESLKRQRLIETTREDVKEDLSGKQKLEIDLERSVDDLNIPVRTKKALRDMEIKFVHELIEKTEEELLKNKDLGYIGLRELKKVLGDMGLSLRTAPTASQETKTEPAATPPATPDTTSAPAKEKGKEKGKLKEAIQNDAFLNTVFITPDLNAKIDKLLKEGYKIKNPNQLKDLVHKFLEIFYQEQGSKNPMPGKKKSLNIESLSACGVTPDNAGDFSRRLQEFLREVKEEVVQPVTPPTPPAPPTAPQAAKAEPPAVEPAKPASPAPATPPPAPQPQAPAVTPVAPTPAPTPMPAGDTKTSGDPAKDVKKDAKIEDINEVMKRLYEAIKNDPEFKELIGLMNLLKIDPKTITDKDERGEYLKAMVSTFGTEQIQDVLKALRNGSNGPLKNFVQPGYYTDKYEVDPQDAVKKLLAGLSGVDDTERLKVMRQRTHTLVEGIHALKISTSKSAPSPAPAPTSPAPAPTPTPAAPAAAPAPAPAAVPLTPEETELEALRTKYKDDTDMLDVIDIAVTKKGPEQGIMAARIFEKMREGEAKKAKAGAPAPAPVPAPAPTPAPAPAPKASPDKIAMPASLAQAIEEAAEGSAELKERLINLWKVAQKKAKSSEMTDTIEKMMGQALQLSKNPKRMSFAVKVLNDLLDRTITADITPLSGEAVDLGRLRQLVEDLAEDEYDSKELMALLNDLSKILEADPAGYPKSAILESIQNEIRKILPQALGAKSIHELLEKFDPKIGYLDQLDALQKLFNELKKNGKLPAMIERAKKIIGSKGPGGGTPPAPPATPPATPPAAPAAGGASGAAAAAGPAPAAAAAASSAPPPAASAPPPAASGPASSPSISSPSMHAGPHAPNFPSQSARWEAINGFISGVGLDPGSKEPAMVALRSVMSFHIDSPAKLANLEQYIGTLDFRGRSLEDLETEKERKEDERDTLQRRIIDLEQQRKKIKPTSPDRDAIEKELRKLGDEKLTLISQIKTLGKGIKRKANETGKEIQLDNPEQLLGAVNMYFATQAARGKAPDFKVVLAHTLKQIEAAKKKEIGRGGKAFDWAYKWLNPLSHLKPRLSATLVLIAEKDDALKDVVKPEKAAKLAEIYNKPESVARWIKDLGGKEKYADNMERVVPALISHLSAAVNNGRMANINTWSLENARTLLNILRDIVHNYAIDHAKTQKGGDVDKMSAYFEKLNSINKDSKERENFVMWNSMKQSWIKAGGLAAGIAGGAGALAVAGLSAPVIIGASVAGIAAPLTYASYRLTDDPKTRALLQKTAVRFVGMGALGGLALAATPWLLPVAAVGLFSPEVWKNRKQIATTTAKYAPPVAKGTLKVGYHTTRIAARTAWAGTGAWVSLFGLGLPLFNQRFRNFFGMHFRPLIGK